MNLWEMDNPETWPELKELIRRIKISYRRLTRDYRPESAEDIVQEVLTRWMERPRTGQTIDYAVIDVLRESTGKKSDKTYEKRLRMKNALPLLSFDLAFTPTAKDFEEAWIQRDEINHKVKALFEAMDENQRTNRRGKKSKFLKRKVAKALIQMVLEGYTHKEIGKAFRISQSRVSQIFKKYNELKPKRSMKMEFHQNTKLYLSKREAEVVKEVLKGLPNKEIADRLFVTEKTVKFHLTNIYKKLFVTSRHELTSKWYLGKITPEMIGPYCWSEMKDEVSQPAPRPSKPKAEQVARPTYNPSYDESLPLPVGNQALI